MSNLINMEAFSKLLLPKLNEGIREAAEPILKKALEDIELTMRQKLASMVIALISEDVFIDRFGRDIRIIVKHENH